MGFKSGVYSVIHASGDADFANYMYYEIYASAAATPTINGVAVSMGASSTLPIILKSISSTANVFVLGDKIDVTTGPISLSKYNFINVSTVVVTPVGAFVTSGNAQQYTGTTTPSDATQPILEWSVTPVGSATLDGIAIDSDGLLTTGSGTDGNFTVTATATDGSRVSDSVNVNVASLSDARLKDNITPTHSISGIEFVTWDWKPEAEVFGKVGHDSGVVAQQIASILPEAVVKGDDGYLRVSYSKINDYLLGQTKV